MTTTALIATWLLGAVIASPRGRVASPARFWVGVTLMLAATAGLALALLGGGAA